MANKLSSEANIGKIFLLVGFILGFIAGFLMTAIGAFLVAVIPLQMAFLAGIYLIFGILMIAGSVITVIAYMSASSHQFRKAGILGIIGSLVPPLNIFSLVGAILCLVSAEAKAGH